MRGIQTQSLLLQALAAAAAAWDTQLLDSFLQEQGDKNLEEDWVVPQGPEGVNWTARNESEMTPLINMEIMWLLKQAEDRLSNASGVPFAIKTARRLAMYNSAAYCTHEWIQKWNCTRCAACLLLPFRTCVLPCELHHEPEQTLEPEQLAGVLVHNKASWRSGSK